MFEQNTIIKTPAAAEAWLRPIVKAYGSGGFVSFPKDCEEIGEQFAKVGVQISKDDANSFWNANSENLQSGWVGLSIDCVAALVRWRKISKAGVVCCLAWMPCGAPLPHTEIKENSRAAF